MKQSIFITGATSGIGRSLSFEFAKRGHDLALSGRREGRLEEIRNELQKKYPGQKFIVKRLDVTDYGSIASVIEEAADELGGLDVAIANAGINLEEKIGKHQFENSKRIIETNLIGAIATADAAASYFLKKGKGHIVGIGSIAAFRGLPSVPSYSASKAGLRTYFEAIRAGVYGKNIDVTIINPGYIDTDMNNKERRRPFVISSYKGAAIMANLIERRVKSAMVPAFPWRIIAVLIRIVPTRILVKLVRK